MNTDWDINEGLDPEGPSGADLHQFGDELTPCPHCHQQIYDQAAICPHCGQYLTQTPKPPPVWAVIGIIGFIILLLIALW